MIRKLILIFLLLLPHISYAKEVELLKYNTINDIEEMKADEETAILILSSRYYIDDLRKLVGDRGYIYWVLPFPQVEEKDLLAFRHLAETLGRHVKINFTSEGAYVEEEGWLDYKIISYLDLNKVVYDKIVILLDVDFFFRLYINSISKVNNEKTLEIMKFYRSIESYELNVNQIYLILSRDINLPEWAEEFGYLIEKIYHYWKKKEFPTSYVLLDEVGKYIVFAQYEEAYEILLDVFPEQSENPYFYEKMLFISSKLRAFNDMLKAFEEGYKRNSAIIFLVPDIAKELLQKREFYPSYLLVKSAYEKEIWNKEIKKLLEDIILEGYKFYNMLNEDSELFEFFKSELEKLKSKK